MNWNWPHVHLLLNHVPVLGAVFGLALLIAALAIKSTDLKKASLVVFVVAAIIAVPVYLSGEAAEGIVEYLPGVAESVVDLHSDWAFSSILALGVLGLFSLGSLWWSAREVQALPTWIVTIVVILSLIVSGMMLWTANLGGQIRHTEIRAESQPTTPDHD